MLRLLICKVILILLLSGIFSSSDASAKPAVNFDSIYTYVATSLAATNNDSAFLIADYLLQKSADDVQKIRSLMLLATLNERKGDMLTAINFARISHDLAQKIRNNDWLFRINGFLSSAYRTVGLVEKGRMHLEEAKQVLKHLKESALLTSFLQQEQAEYYILDKRYAEALTDLLKANQNIDQYEPQLGAYFFAINYNLIGNCYEELKDFSLAGKYYRLSLDKLDSIETELKGFNYLGLATIAIREGNFNEALPYLQLAEKYAAASKNYKIRLLLYDNYSKYYNYTGQNTLALKYNNDYLDLVKEQTENTRAITNLLLSEKEDPLPEKDFTMSGIILLVVAVLSVVLVVYIVKYRKQKQIIGKMGNVIDDFRQSSARAEKPGTAGAAAVLPGVTDPPDPGPAPAGEITPPVPVPEKEHPPAIKKDTEPSYPNVMSRESAEALLEKLNALEQDAFFLNQDVSLAKIASVLQTNTKYLSYVINHYKKYDFNNYVNRLRIFYIVDKLKREPEYWDYKISYLAEECGFSSHSKFATVFKQMIGLSPSDFIRQLKEN